MNEATKKWAFLLLTLQKLIEGAAQAKRNCIRGNRSHCFGSPKFWSYFSTSVSQDKPSAWSNIAGKLFLQLLWNWSVTIQLPMESTVFLATDFTLHYKDRWVLLAICMLITIQRIFKLWIQNSTNEYFFYFTFICIKINMVYSFTKFFLLNNLWQLSKQKFSMTIYFEFDDFL